jgi:hypothetical protein
VLVVTMSACAAPARDAMAAAIAMVLSLSFMLCYLLSGESGSALQSPWPLGNRHLAPIGATRFTIDLQPDRIGVPP